MDEKIMDEKRLILTQSIMELLDDWKLMAKDKITLLGLPDDVRVRHLEQYRKDKAFPETEQINAHLVHLVGIADALRTTYPRNLEMGNIWLKQTHKRLNNRAPMDIMLGEGLKGMRKVRAILDCSYEWSLTGSSH